MRDSELPTYLPCISIPRLLLRTMRRSAREGQGERIPRNLVSGMGGPMHNASEISWPRGSHDSFSRRVCLQRLPGVVLLLPVYKHCRYLHVKLERLHKPCILEADPSSRQSLYASLYQFFGQVRVHQHTGNSRRGLTAGP